MRPHLVRFLEKVGRGENPQGAFSEAFEASQQTIAGQFEAYVQAGDYPFTRIEFEDLVVEGTAESRQLSRAESLVRLGDLITHADAEKPEGAAGHYRRAIELEPELAMAHRGLGAVLELLGQPEAAAVSAEEAIRLDPTDDLALMLRARSRLETMARQHERDRSSVHAGALASVRQLLQRAIELNPDRADSYRLLGTALALEGSCDRAPQMLKRAWQMMPSDLTIAANLAQVLGLCGEAEAAEYIVETFLTPYAGKKMADGVDDAMLVGEFNSATDLANQGKFDEAADRLERVAELADDPELRAEAERRLESVRLHSQGRTWESEFNAAIRTANRGDHQQALAMVQPILEGLRALDAEHAGKSEELRQAVEGFAESVRVSRDVERADELARAGEFRQSLGLLAETQARAERFLEKPTGDDERARLVYELEQVETARRAQWRGWYEHAVQVLVGGEREKAGALVREIAETCPYDDTVASARKVLNELGP